MKVWILKLSTSSFETLEAYVDKASAQVALHDYVYGEWDDGLTEQYGDIEVLTHDGAIEAYFDAFGSAHDPEFYTLTETELQGELTEATS